MPYDEGGRLSELHDLAGEMEREETAEGVRVRARVPAAWPCPASSAFAGERRPGRPVRLRFARLSPTTPARPTRAHHGDAGYDLRAAEGAVLGPGERGERGDGRGGGNTRTATRDSCSRAPAWPHATASRW